MLHPTLAVRVDDEAEVFGPPLEVEGENELALSRLTLPYEEDAVSRIGVRLALQHQLSGVCPTQGAVEPWVDRQLTVDLGYVVHCWK